MEGFISPIERDILEKAQSRGLLTFEPNNIDGQISLVLKMMVQINCYQANNERPINELAILYKRFSINAGTIVNSIPIIQQTQYAPKTKFLQTQI